MKEFELNELPDTVYVTMEELDHRDMWKKLLKNKTIKELSKKHEISIRNLYKYKEGNSGYPIKVLEKILRVVSMKIHRATIKTQRNSNIMKIKLPLKITDDFSEFLGYLLGDGGIDHQWGVHMTSNDTENLENFDFLINRIFGQVKKQVYKYENRMTYYYPKILGLILTDTFKISKGSKVDTNSHIPEFILDSMTQTMKKKFITSFYECDGASKFIRITQGGKSLKLPPKILSQIKNMLTEFNFKNVIIKPSSIYKTSKGERRRWVLNISNSKERKKFRTLFSCKKLSQLNIGSRV